MSGIKEYIRYSSDARKLFYKILKFCDGIPVYRSFYRKRILKLSSLKKDFPEELSIETTNLCNAKCTMCPHPWMKRVKGKMDTELVKSLIDQAADHNVRKLFLSGFGEPLIDKRIPEFIAYAKEKKIKNISIVTNGYLLQKELAYKVNRFGLERDYNFYGWFHA